MTHTFQIVAYQSGAAYRQLASTSNAPILLLDCNLVRQRYRSLQKALPNTKLYYAVKSLPHPAMIKTLRDLGAGFDIASSGEVALMRQQKVFPRSCIHTHPIKTDAEIRSALRLGCTTFVVDNIAELEKFISYRRRVGLLLRISFRHSGAKVDLSKKFGCDVQRAEQLIERARELGIRIKGLSFHVGSQCNDATKHVEAIHACAQLMQRMAGKGIHLHVLDIGGGFPVNYENPEENNIDDFCLPIREALQTLPNHIEVIAEPGRYLSAPAMMAITTIVGKSERQGQCWYYLNDGVYGSYSGQIYDHANYPITVFSDSKKRLPSVLTGPTCDSIDIIAEGEMLPELNIGDVIVARMMGAYTLATASRFNLLPAIDVRVINQDEQTAQLRTIA